MGVFGLRKCLASVLVLVASMSFSQAAELWFRGALVAGDFGPRLTLAAGDTMVMKVFKDKKPLPVVKWAVKSDGCAVLLEEATGILDTFEPGVAVVEAHVPGDSSMTIYQFPIVIEGSKLKLTLSEGVTGAPTATDKPPTQLSMYPGEKKAIAAYLWQTKPEGGYRRVRKRAQFFSGNAASIQFSGAGLSVTSNTASTYSGEGVTLQAGLAGTSHLIVRAGGQELELTVKVEHPQITLKLVAQGKEATAIDQDAGGEAIASMVTDNLSGAAERYKVALEVKGAKLAADAMGAKQAFVALDQGVVTATATLMDGTGNPIKGVLPVTKTLKVNPKIATVTIGKIRPTIVKGDRVAIEVTALDPRGKVIGRGERGPLTAELTAVSPLAHDPVAPLVKPLARMEMTTEGDFLRVVTTPEIGSFTLTVKPEADPRISSTTRVRIVEPVEVSARQLRFDQHLRDYLGKQVAKEFYAYELTATNNLGQIEEPGSLLKGASINLLGSTLLMPIRLIRGETDPEPRSTTDETGQTWTNIRESSPEDIRRFVDSNMDAGVTVYVPPIYQERFALVKDAVNYRDPAAVAQRFFGYVANIADFMSAQFPGANSNPFRGEGDSTRRTAAKLLLDSWFSLYEGEKALKGKVAPTEMLSRSTTVTPDRPITVIYLIPKDTWGALEKNAKWRVSFYELCDVRISYEITIRSEQVTGNRAQGG